MRVLMLSKACLVGAYQRKLEEIARSPDVELTVAVPPSWHDGTRMITLERAHTAGYNLVTEHLAFNGSYHLHFYPSLARRIRSVNPDIVHVDEEPYNLATYHALRLAKRAGCRTLWFSWQNLVRRYPFPFSLFERYSIHSADYALVGSAGAEAAWRHKGYSGPLAIVPQFGVDTAIFTPRRPRREKDAPFVVGFAGRLVPEKGIGVLLRALTELDTSFRASILGRGPARARLKQMATSLRLADRISWLDELHSGDMPAFYHSLDALVLPSLSRRNWVEQFGRVLIEAMACGTPVVGSQSGEIPGVIGDAGLTFPEGDSAALAQHLYRLQHDPRLWADLTHRGRRRVEAQFTQHLVASRTVQVYREIAAARAGERHD
jgi:glycosyltransferase involved in cell wall biosynthesis